MRKPWRNTALAILVGLVLIGLGLIGFRTALTQAPPFYAAAVAVTPASQAAAGRELERTVLSLHNDVRNTGEWSIVLSDRQVNGWLAVDLPEKFPDLLPATLQDPRVAFTSGRVQIACRYQGSKLDAIINLSLEITLADEPNTVAVRFCQAQAGLVPLPMKEFLAHISDAARRADLMLKWLQEDGDPVALISVADDRQGPADPRVTLEAVAVREGEIRLAGRTEELSTPPSSPDEPPAEKPLAERKPDEPAHRGDVTTDGHSEQKRADQQ